MARRLYLGKLPSDTRTDDVSKLFEGFGRLVDVRVMNGFGFVEFERSRDAEDALYDLKGKPFLGAPIIIEFAKENRGRRNDYEERSFAPRRRPAGIRVLVDNISRDTSWQDLKDFGREAGSVSFADIDRDVQGRGILEYLTRDDAEQAVKDLDGRDLRGQPVRVTMDEERGGPDNFRRGDDGYRGDRYSERDRYKDRGDRYDRDRDDRNERRRGRSGSPPPRRDDRARSPPPRRDFDEKRSARDEPYERRRDDGKRRDERDSRYEDRPSRSNGDAGWSR